MDNLLNSSQKWIIALSAGGYGLEKFSEKVFIVTHSSDPGLKYRDYWALQFIVFFLAVFLTLFIADSLFLCGLFEFPTPKRHIINLADFTSIYPYVLLAKPYLGVLGLVLLNLMTDRSVVVPLGAALGVVIVTLFVLPRLPPYSLSILHSLSVLR
jgi:hypothetical protein